MQEEKKYVDTYYSYNEKYTQKLHYSLVMTTCSGTLGILIAFFYYLCKNVFSPQSISKIYTDIIFYYINMPLRLFSGIFLFSVGELLFYALIIFFLFSFIKTIYITTKMIIAYNKMKKINHPTYMHYSFKPLINFFFRVISLVCSLISIFILSGGINYTGQTYAEKLQYDTNNITKNDLISLCVYLGDMTSAAREHLVLDSNGTINDEYPGYNPYILAEDALNDYDSLPDYYGVSKRYYPRVKFAITSKFMSHIHITGIYPYIFPEAIVNINTPIMSLPHTICHEMAHQRGFAREDEANFIAYLACIQSENPLIRYSGYYTAFNYAMNQLYIYDINAWSYIMQNINQYVLLDIKEEAAYWDKYQTINSNITTEINNSFLSTMDIEDGVKSYGRVVDLLIAESKRTMLIK